MESREPHVQHSECCHLRRAYARQHLVVLIAPSVKVQLHFAGIAPRMSEDSTWKVWEAKRGVRIVAGCWPREQDMARASGVALHNGAAVARGQHGLHEGDRVILDAQLHLGATTVLGALPLLPTCGAECGRRVASVERSTLGACRAGAALHVVGWPGLGASMKGKEVACLRG